MKIQEQARLKQAALASTETNNPIEGEKSQTSMEMLIKRSSAQRFAASLNTTFSKKEPASSREPTCFLQVINILFHQQRQPDHAATPEPPPLTWGRFSALPADPCKNCPASASITEHKIKTFIGFMPLKLHIFGLRHVLAF